MNANFVMRGEIDDFLGKSICINRGVGSFLLMHVCEAESDAYEDINVGLIWLYGANWSLHRETSMIINSDTDRSVSLPLERWLKLIAISDVDTTGRFTLFFDCDLCLRVNPSCEDMDEWMIFTPLHVFTYGNGCLRMESRDD